VTFGSFFVFVLVADLAGAQDASPKFGSQGELVISSDAQFFLAGQSGGLSSTVLSVAPAADYFVVRGLSLGAAVSYTYARQQVFCLASAQTSNGIGVSPRLGYNFRLSEAFSLWPKVGVGLKNTWFNIDTTSSPQCVKSGAVMDPAVANETLSEGAFDLDLDALLVFHPAPHFFLGLGPYLTTDLAVWGTSNSVSAGPTLVLPKITTYGISFTVGGWVGGG
jgi:hypothetical protein